MELELPKDFREFLKSLNANGVKYLLIGGYAVVSHGLPAISPHHSKINRKANDRHKNLNDLENLP
jgi:hypothetical protein